MKKKPFAIVPKTVLSSALIVVMAFTLGAVIYFLAANPGKVQAPIVIIGNELRNEERDNAEESMKSYLEDLKIKTKQELAEYFTDDLKKNFDNLKIYFDEKKFRLDEFEVLKTERIGNQEFIFVVREFQKDAKYGVIGYVDNKYGMIKSGDKYILKSVEIGEYVDTSETKDWIFVRNIEKGYEFKYPENFFYGEPEISVSQMAGKSSLQGCYSRNFKGFIVKKVAIGGIEYCLSESTDGNSGNVFVDSSFTNVEKNKIATLHFIVRYPNCSSLWPADSSEFSGCEEDNKKGAATLERTVSTFRFLSATSY